MTRIIKHFNEFADLEDEQLFKLVQDDNDSRAFEILYNRYWDVLWRFASKHQIHTEEAKDTLQDIFTHLWTNRAKIHIQYKVRSYLYRATVNQVLKKVNRNQFLEAYVSSITRKVQEGGLHQEEIIYEKELQVNINAALNAMPEKMRAIFEASRFEELNHAQIAEKLNISKETVKSQIKNALKIVRKHVKSFLFSYL